MAGSSRFNAWRGWLHRVDGPPGNTESAMNETTAIPDHAAFCVEDAPPGESASGHGGRDLSIGAPRAEPRRDPELDPFYGSLPSALANDLRDAAAVIWPQLRQIERSRLEVGQQLLRIQEKLGHGTFKKWLELEFKKSWRTAYNWISGARVLPKIATVANLGPGVIEALTAPSVAERDRDNLVEGVVRGQLRTGKDVRTAARKAKLERTKSSIAGAAEVTKHAMIPQSGQPSGGGTSSDPNESTRADEAAEYLMRWMDCSETLRFLQAYRDLHVADIAVAAERKRSR